MPPPPLACNPNPNAVVGQTPSHPHVYSSPVLPCPSSPSLVDDGPWMLDTKEKTMYSPEKAGARHTCPKRTIAVCLPAAYPGGNGADCDAMRSMTGVSRVCVQKKISNAAAIVSS